MRIVLLLLLLPCPWLLGADKPGLLDETHVYKQVGDTSLNVRVLKPATGNVVTPRRAIVFFHGGGWVGGKVTQFEQQARHFATRGFVCFLVQYRFVPQDDITPPIVCIQDARSAMRWVRQHASRFEISPDLIAAVGGSAGGHLAAHAALIDAVDDLADNRDISPKPNALLLFNPVLDNGPGQFGVNRVKDRLAEFSPAHNIHPGAPPTILFLGSKDKLVSVSTLERFRDTMQASGARCELIVYPGEEHGFFNPNRSVAHYRATLEASEQFLESLGWLASMETAESSHPNP